MSVRRWLRRVVLAAVLLGLAAFAAAERVPGLAVVLMGLAVAGWLVTERDAGKAGRGWEGLPRWVANLALLLVLVGSLVRGFAGESAISAFLAFLAAITVLKLWEKRELRDYGQMLTMSLFLTVGATLNDNRLLLGAAMVAQTPVLLAGAMLYQLSVSRARAAALLDEDDRGEGVDARHGPTPIAEWAQLRRPLAVVAGSALLAGVAIAAVVFVLTPRGMGLERFGAFARPAAGRVSGFTDRVDLNMGGLISQSESVMMFVQLSDAVSGEPLGSIAEPLYLRGAVLDEYANGRWQASAPARRAMIEIGQQQRGGTWLTLGDATVRPRMMVQRIEPLFESRGRGPLFHVLSPIAVRLPSAASVWYGEAGSVIEGDGLGRDDRWYEVKSDVSPRRPVVLDDGPAQWDNALVADEAARVLRAQRIEPDGSVRPPEEDGRAVRALELYLRSELAYTLDPPVPPVGTQDPTAWFLTQGRRGHCEFFASALAAMSRSIGVRARVVAGYLSTEFDPDRSRYVVRASDAHAWVEAEIAPGQWVTFDGTPEGTAAYRRPEQTGLVASLALLGDRINNFWNSAVVSFDQTTQRRLLGMRDARGVRHPGALEQFSAWVVRRTELDINNPQRRSVGQMITRWLMGLGAVLALAGVAYAAWWIWRRRRAMPARLSDGWALRGHSRLIAEREQVLRILRSVGAGERDGAERALLDRARHAPEAIREDLLARVDALERARFSRQGHSYPTR